ncbi:MAG: hypothetical protein ACO4AU_11105 [bacterium]
MSLLKHSLLSSVFLLLLVASCGNPESVVTTSSKSADPETSTPQPVSFSIRLGESGSRTQRFLGTFDEIDSITLDLTRNYGNKAVVVGHALTKDNATGRWSGTIDNLIIGFDYTVVGHAYKDESDNGTFVEIFTGETQHTVTSGQNSLALSLTPILDDRELKVPRITRIQRPFQIRASTSENVTVSVETNSSNTGAIDGEIFYRFRSVDEQFIPKTTAEGGSFSPSDTSGYCTGTCPDVSTTYGATDNHTTQKIQVRVANEQEIGVITHFYIYVTDTTEFTNSDFDFAPVIESLFAEIQDNGTLKWTANISNDDGFLNTQTHWDYWKGGQSGLRNFEETYPVEADGDIYRGQVGAVMTDYQSEDDGYLYLTVCESWTSSCEVGAEGSTTLEFRLIAGAYTKPLVCDGDFCGFGIWDQSTWDSTTFGD